MKDKIFDLHNDLLTASSLEEGEIVAKKNKKSGYRSIYAIYKGNISLKQATDICRKAVSFGVSDFAFEDGFYEDEDEFIRLAARVKARYVSLCWNDENAYAGGCKTDVGIKKAGYKFIKRLNENKIPLDLAHASRKTFFDGIEKADGVLCSHAAFDFVNPHVRNLSYEQIKLIIERGGIIGLTFVGYFLLSKGRSSRASAVEAFYKNVDSYLQKFGDEGLCIGSDFYGSDFLAFEGYRSFIEGFAARLTVGGVPKKSIDNILYGNASAFFCLGL